MGNDSHFNRNIAALRWGIKNDTVRGYRLRCDDLNRLTEAQYAQGNDLKGNPGYFSETITGYDKNGNIIGLRSTHNNILVDDLAYQYYDSGKSNRLKKITDTGLEGSGIDDYPGTSMDYLYDASGNMRKDGSKNLHIEYYKTLNLPGELDFGNDNRIFYHYTAGGTKLMKHSVLANGIESYTHYIGNIVYEGGALSYILTDEGRIIVDGIGADRKFLYEYNLKDHLGNTRVTFMANGTGGTAELVQSTDYYPFGLVMNQYNRTSSPEYRKNEYLYNGKELQDDFIEGSSLNWFDYGARFYDPQIGRWHSLDMMADLTYSWTPYRYAFNNPIRFIDPNGMTEEERIKALQVARSLLGTKYASALPQNDRVTKGELDCSGLVRYSIMQNESINEPFNSKGNGVTQIMNSSRKVGLNDVREGDLVVIKSGDNENGHVGFITNIVRDKDGNIIRYTLLHSEAAWTNATLGISGGGDINKDVIEVGSEKGYAKSKYNHRYYQWDNPETENNAQNKPYNLESYMKENSTAVQDNTRINLSSFVQQIHNLPQGKYKVVNGQIVPE